MVRYDEWNKGILFIKEQSPIRVDVKRELFNEVLSMKDSPAKEVITLSSPLPPRLELGGNGSLVDTFTQ